MGNSNKTPSLHFNSELKSDVFADTEKYIASMDLQIEAKDMSRPWGGFFVIKEQQSDQFAKSFFPDIPLTDLYLGGKLSPKFLVVQPGKRLSWQYHNRRAEVWRLIAGTAGVVTSKTDKEGDVQQLSVGEIVRLGQGQRHRLVGLKEWGVIAEIWQHTDSANPSDEDDIVRLQDDFGRKSPI